MTREEQKAILADILANGADTGKISELVTALAEDYMGVTATSEMLAAENAKLTADNASLVSQNMALFLKVGTPITAASEVPEEVPVEDLKFEDLFDENSKLI